MRMRKDGLLRKADFFASVSSCIRCSGSLCSRPCSSELVAPTELGFASWSA